MRDPYLVYISVLSSVAGIFIQIVLFKPKLFGVRLVSDLFILFGFWQLLSVNEPTTDLSFAIWSILMGVGTNLAVDVTRSMSDDEGVLLPVFSKLLISLITFLMILYGAFGLGLISNLN